MFECHSSRERPLWCLTPPRERYLGSVSTMAHKCSSTASAETLGPVLTVNPTTQDGCQGRYTMTALHNSMLCCSGARPALNTMAATRVRLSLRIYSTRLIRHVHPSASCNKWCVQVSEKKLSSSNVTSPFCLDTFTSVCKSLLADSTDVNVKNVLSACLQVGNHFC